MPAPHTPTYANTVPVMERHRFDAGSLDRYLHAHLDNYRGGLEVRQFDSGHSNPTFFVSAEMKHPRHAADSSGGETPVGACFRRGISRPGISLTIPLTVPLNQIAHTRLGPNFPLKSTLAKMNRPRDQQISVLQKDGRGEERTR